MLMFQSDLQTRKEPPAPPAFVGVKVVVDRREVPVAGQCWRAQTPGYLLCLGLLASISIRSTL
jgi:hypothetical protein